MKQIAITVLFFIFLDFGNAQSPFRGYITMGLNASQINGDLLAGYHKVGLTGGFGVSYNLKDNIDFSTELLYSQRGSKNKLFPSAGRNFVVKMDYAEIPFLISIKDWWIEEKKYHKVKAYTGFSFSNLISSSTNISELSTKIDSAKGQDLSYIIGAEYFFTNKVGFNIRYTRDFISFYKNPANKNDYLLGYFLSFRMSYNF